MAVAWLLPASARAASCSLSGPPAIVNMRVDEGRVAINNAHSQDELSVIRHRTSHGRQNGLLDSAGWRSAGLTVSDTGYRLGVKIEASDLGAGRVCARLTNATLDVGLRRLDVYVARRYRPGTCTYRTVLAHEYQHVAIFRGELKRHVPTMRQRLIAAAGRLAPVVAVSPDAAARYFQHRLQAELEPIFRQMTDAAERANGQLDTANNYRHTQARCSQW